MIDNGKLTLLDIEELAKKAHEFKVEFNITIQPDSVEVTLSPWYPTVTESNYTQKPKEEPKVYITDSPVMTTEEIKAKAERIKQEMKDRTIMP